MTDGNANSNDHLMRHDLSEQSGNEIGEAAGGISGVVIGAAVGALAGPAGAVIGGVAGAIGGWWTGKSVAQAASEYTEGDDAVYRNHYDNSSARLADRDYESVSPAYRLGHLAAHNPDYRGRPFNQVESDLRNGWNSSAGKKYGEWDAVRGYVNDGYDRSANGIEQRRLREEINDAAEESDKRLDASTDLDLI
jgi:hypothetical protein